MEMRFGLASVVLAFALVASSAAASPAPDLSGVWQVRSSAVPGTMTCTLSRDAPPPGYPRPNEYRFAGQCVSPGATRMGCLMLWNGGPTKNAISCLWQVQMFNGRVVNLQLIAGDVTGPGGTHAFDMTRQAP
jgi:hypothetical protein